MAPARLDGRTVAGFKRRADRLQRDANAGRIDRTRRRPSWHPDTIDAGSNRVVLPLDDQHVVKVTHRFASATFAVQNVIEWLWWTEFADDELRQSLAPCVTLTDTGALVMARCEPLDDRSPLPEIRAHLTERYGLRATRRDWALLDGRPVLVDYGSWRDITIGPGADVDRRRPVSVHSPRRSGDGTRRPNLLPRVLEVLSDIDGTDVPTLERWLAGWHPKRGG